MTNQSTKLANLEAGRTLNDRQRLLVSLIADGLSLDDAASKLKVQKRYVREALRDSMIKAELAQTVQSARLALQPKAISKLGALIDSRTENVALNASKAILGDDGKAPTVNVGVQVNNQLGVSFRPGYVIRLPQTESTVIDHDQEA